MNNQRRKDIGHLISSLENLQNGVAEALEGEEEAYENLSDSIQDGDRGEKMSEAISCLEDASDSLQETIDSLHNAIEGG